MEIRIAGIVKESIVDGPGIRLTVFTQGCEHGCRGCHNPETHQIDGGKMEDINSIIAMLKENKLLAGITISGGEPFLQPREIELLLRETKELGYNTIVYTGYTFKEILQREEFKRVLDYIDVLIDGRFIENKKNLLLKFKGSENQRIIDVRGSLKYNKIIEIEV